MASATLRQRAASPSANQQFKESLLREAEDKEAVEGKRFVLPNYTVKQLLDAIPADCFQRSAIRSSLYIVQDVVAIAGLVYLTFQIEPFLAKFDLSAPVYWASKAALYFAYQVAAGMFGTGLWVIAHECGHQSFSPSKQINNTVGWFLHSALLVPYHSWRISHGRHHAATNHLTRDEVHVPRSRKELGYPEIKEEGEYSGLSVSAARQQELREAIDESPISLLYNMLLQQVFGWPLYLIKNASGQLHYPSGTNHFDPRSIIFKPTHGWQVLVSDLGVFLTLAALGVWSYYRSFAEMMTLYFVPYLWVNHWLVMITYLQHTDPMIPHYSAKTWTFARGALATIDRTLMGPLGGLVFHGICETHVVHHTCSKIPHYNAWKATDALKEFLGPHYLSSNENMFVSFYRCYRDCVFVEDGQDVAFWKDPAGRAAGYAVDEAGVISDSGVDMADKK